MKRRMAAVGRVTVSLKRSTAIAPAPGLIPRRPN
jgi:hypothetical protein